jgi:hypothetical protein
MKNADPSVLVAVLLKKLESRSERAIEAEKFLMELHKMNWWQFIWCKPKIFKFLKSRLTKYEY